MAPPPKRKILIVDDHPVFCLGMSELINKAADLTVCGSEETPSGAMKAIQRLSPDLVIVDISLKESNGIDLIGEINARFRGLPTLVLSMYDESLYAERALMAGARGYLMKQEAIAVVVEAIHQVLQGKVYASEAVKEKVFQRLVSPHNTADTSPLDALTSRELETFRLIGQGLSTREIAERMKLSIKTIGTYRERIKEKLNLKHYTELVKAAVHYLKITEK
ncbi:DNA-binding response regulator [Desulfosarcina ovata subsp. sediminis]|uniref:DNA-binding response regulator n=1 Tax=Desulfosarcina ovata subsp. sediminis TaxID=885957 RepID=A0A5K7ZIL2_9BACT|nr:response regulator transcription factor [Desulfosarcina ovata]BBO80721.1 DNA-binding response regulator [Desulfosarcina ovata subsp. sediminis]